MDTDITGEIIIGRAFERSDQTFRAIEAKTGQPLSPDFACATPEQVERACTLGWRAFHIYRQTTTEERARFLEAVSENIDVVGDRLVQRAHSETGLSIQQLRLELTRTVRQLMLFADVVRQGDWLDARIDHAIPDRLPLPRLDLRLRNIAIGPVAVFGSSNFPLAFSVAGGDTASALAAGCPVVVKGHPAHPGTSELAGRAIQKAVAQCALPEGAFSLLTGPSHELGAALVAHPHVKAVGFTGSRGGGMALWRLAQQRREPIPVFAEMSSINPVLILPNALRSRAAELARAYVTSLTLGTGQFCTNPGLVIAIESSDLDRFVAAAAEALGQTTPTVMLTPSIHGAYAKGLDRIRSVAGTKTVAASPSPDEPYCSQATIFSVTADHFLAHPALGEENFGPSSIVVRCRDLSSMQTVIEHLEGQLTATLQIDEEDHDDAQNLLSTLEVKAGRILINGWPTGVEVAHAMVHGGPFPATSDSRFTSVGTLAIRRFLRPVSYQNAPDNLLPISLKQNNPLGYRRLVDGLWRA